MNSFKFYTVVVALSLAVGISSCTKEETVTPSTEFTATDAAFAGFSAWTQTTTPKTGDDPSGFLKGAHDEKDGAVTRYIYINNGSATRSNNGEYPNGTVIVKDMKKGGVSAGVMAMVKRGGTFNSANKGWEWFVLNSEGKIQSRGADLMSGACNGCHSVVTARDFVFTKQ